MNQKDFVPISQWHQFRKYLLANVGFEAISRRKIDPQAKQVTELVFQFDQPQQSGYFLETQKDIQIAVGIGIPADTGTEQTERFHSVALP